MADPIYSQVYVYNLYRQQAKLQDVNGMGPPPTSTIAAPVKGSTPPYWVPNQAAVDRTNLPLGNLQGPEFTTFENSLVVNYGSGGQSWRATFNIPDAPNPDYETDLWLYLAHKQLFLVDSSNGNILAGPVTLKEVASLE
jgi:hypothetical protein